MKKVFCILLTLTFLFVSGCGSNTNKNVISVEGVSFTEAIESDIHTTDANFYITGSCLAAGLDYEIESMAVYYWTIKTDIGTFDLSMAVSGDYYENMEPSSLDSWIGLTLSVFGRFSETNSASTGNPVFQASHIEKNGDIIRFTVENVFDIQKSNAASNTSTASTEPDHIFSSYFQELINDGVERPDYSVFSKPASENGKDETEIVMFGTFGDLYEVNGYTVIDFWESGENLYALSLGSPDKNITDLYTTFANKEAEVYGLYLGYSDMLHAPTGFLYITYCDGELYTDSFVHIAGDGITNYSGGYASSEQEASKEESSSADSITLSQSNCLSKAHEYLDFLNFSRDGLVSQLEYEGFSHEDAVYAADHCGADWNKQALGKANEYLEFTYFSYTGLIDQLEYEGFTSDQAAYGVDNCNADWKKQAAGKAEEYLDFMSFSRGDLIEQLIYDGFTREQAEYGADQAGL